MAGAWLGGHVVFGMGTTVNRGAFLEGPDDWVDAYAAAAVPPNGMHMVEAGGMRGDDAGDRHSWRARGCVPPARRMVLCCTKARSKRRCHLSLARFTVPLVTGMSWVGPPPSTACSSR